MINGYYIVNKYMVIIWLLYGFHNRLIYAYYQRKLGSNFRVTNDFLLGAIDYDEGW